MAYFGTWVLKHWYRRAPSWLSLLLLPLAFVFGVVAECRASLYRYGFIRVHRLSVPVIVVGNITVGGTGKTPLVIALVKALQAKGYTPAVISRGYGSDPHHEVTEVTPQSATADVGDEPIEIVSATGVLMAVGADRLVCARHLLMRHPNINVIISDDGLQHYRLARTVEIAVFDAMLGVGNGFLLPAGPLRERVSRCGHVDAIVVTGDETLLPPAALSSLQHTPIFRQALKPTLWRNVATPEMARRLESFSDETNVHAVAGIGNPDRFFATLKSLNIAFTPHAFSDHHDYRAEELAYKGAKWILMTEKDAVKCRALADASFWSLTVESAIDESLLTLILRKLRDF
ncbi:MAG: tetraacyldisaccharide 4'-kinase [Burkholderiales bacterium]|nr:tetraacyldisaccharide 4'-kinase [Burkholderiales bacterium]